MLFCQVPSRISLATRSSPSVSVMPRIKRCGYFSPASNSLCSSFSRVSLSATFSTLLSQGIQERRLDGESAALEWSVTHSVEGNIWISVGVKLGVIEVVLGFVQGGFGVVFARRFFAWFREYAYSQASWISEYLLFACGCKTRCLLVLVPAPTHYHLHKQATVFTRRNRSAISFAP